MKLCEIVDSSHIFADQPAEIIAPLLKKLQISAKKILDLNSRIELCQLGSFYCVRRGADVLAWVELGDQVKIKRQKFETLKFIYVVPEARKSMITGLFLLGLKKVLKNPVILGSDKYGGVLFAGGSELVKALGSSAKFTVSIMNLKTGKKIPFDSEKHLLTDKGTTLVFEDDVPLFYDAGAVGIIYLFEDVK